MIQIKGAVTFPSGNGDKVNVTYNVVDESGQTTSSLRRATLVIKDDNKDVKSAIETLKNYIEENVEV